MVQDVITNAGAYRALHRHFAAGFDYLAAFDPSTPDGRYPVLGTDGQDVFALVQSYDTAPPAEKRFETHRERVDIQYLVSGDETMYWAPRDQLVVNVPYDPAKDAMFYSDPPEATALLCRAGTFTIFFPTDGHKGSCWLGAAGAVRKVVLKIRV